MKENERRRRGVNRRLVVNIIIIVLVIGALGAGLYFLTRKEPTENDNLSEYYTDDDKVKIFSYDVEDLVSVGVENQYGTYLLERAEGGWKLSGFDTVPVDPTMVDSLTYGFSSLTSNFRVEAAPDDLSVYGLDRPSASLTLTLKDGTAKTFYIGNKASDNSGSYFNTDSSSDVYFMQSYQVDMINLTARDYADIGESIAAGDITAIEIVSPSGTLKVERSPEGQKDQYGLLSYWDITSPRRQSASNSDVEEKLLTPATQLEDSVSAIIKYDEADDHGLDSPQYRITLTSEAGSVVYAVSAPENEYRYIRRDDQDYILRVDSGACDFAAADAYTVAEKYLALVAINLVQNVNIDYDGEVTRLTVVDGGGDNASYYCENHEVDADVFTDFYMNIVAMDVDGEAVDPVLKDTVGSIEYVLNSGESIKLEFVPYDERNYAVFVNGDGLYYINKKKVTKVFDKVTQTFR